MAVSWASPRRAIRQWPLMIRKSPHSNTTLSNTPNPVLPSSLHFVYASISVNCSNHLSVPLLTNRCWLFFLLQFSIHDRKQLSWHPTSRRRYSVQLPWPPTTLNYVYILASQLPFPSPHLKRACMITATPPLLGSRYYFKLLSTPTCHLLAHYACTCLPRRIITCFISRPEPCSLPWTCHLLAHLSRTTRTMLPSEDMLYVAPPLSHNQNHAPFRGHDICCPTTA